MSWTKFLDTFYDHPKVMKIPARLRNEACGLFVRAVCLSNRHMSDGLVTTEQLASLGGNAELVSTLVRVRLFYGRTKAGVRIKDFQDYNLSRDQMLELRVKRQRAGSIGGKRSGQVRKERSKREAGASGLLEASKGKEFNSFYTDSKTGRAAMRAHERDGSKEPERLSENEFFRRFGSWMQDADARND